LLRSCSYGPNSFEDSWEGFRPRRALRLTPSAISKLVGRLETRLGARLVNRSTRTLQLTPEGRLFYDRSIRLLADMDEVEQSVAEAKVPSGKISVSSLWRYR
jgi:DNA-binding transcriptional LysR family regulator